MKVASLSFLYSNEHKNYDKIMIDSSFMVQYHENMNDYSFIFKKERKG